MKENKHLYALQFLNKRVRFSTWDTIIESDKLEDFDDKKLDIAFTIGIFTNFSLLRVVEITVIKEMKYNE